MLNRCAQLSFALFLPGLFCIATNVFAQSSLSRASTPQNVPIELTFTTSQPYSNPFTDLQVDAVFTGPGAEKQVVPAFWTGGHTWKVRFASGTLGRYSWTLKCSNNNDRSLQKHGTIEVVPYHGSSALYRNGPLHIADDRRHFEYANHTPFLWLGDTWWKGLASRISFAGFKQLAIDRKTKGFNVVQIIAGPYPDEPPFDPRWSNEGGLPYFKNYEHINPGYFDYADQRIQYLINQGIVPAIVGGWGWHMDAVGVEAFNRHWRYLVARYAAYPVVWIAGGEAGGDQWAAVTMNLRHIDPFHRLITLHSFPGSGRSYLTDDSALDFDMLQTGHGGVFGERSPYGIWQATAANTASKVMSAYSKTPPMPVVVGEVTYEGHMRTNGSDVQRQVYWESMLSGAAGHTYGAGGLWQMNSSSERGAEYEFTPWFEAMNLPGSGQLGNFKRLLEEYAWWKFRPHPEWVEPHCPSLLEEHEAWYDDSKRFADSGAHWDRPYAAGIPGQVRFVFIPGHYYDWTAPVIKDLETDTPYHALLIDPASAKRYELGIVVFASDSTKWSGVRVPLNKGLPLKLSPNPGLLEAVNIPNVTVLSTSDYQLPRLPAPQDWLLVLDRLD